MDFAGCEPVFIYLIERMKIVISFELKRKSHLETKQSETTFSFHGKGPAAKSIKSTPYLTSH